MRIVFSTEDEETQAAKQAAGVTSDRPGCWLFGVALVLLVLLGVIVV